MNRYNLIWQNTGAWGARPVPRSRSLRTTASGDIIDDTPTAPPVDLTRPELVDADDVSVSSMDGIVKVEFFRDGKSWLILMQYPMAIVNQGPIEETSAAVEG